MAALDYQKTPYPVALSKRRISCLCGHISCANLPTILLVVDNTRSLVATRWMSMPAKEP
jgi:hypothetical protein